VKITQNWRHVLQPFITERPQTYNLRRRPHGSKTVFEKNTITQWSGLLYQDYVQTQLLTFTSQLCHWLIGMVLSDVIFLFFILTVLPDGANCFIAVFTRELLFVFFYLYFDLVQMRSVILCNKRICMCIYFIMLTSTLWQMDWGQTDGRPTIALNMYTIYCRAITTALPIDPTPIKHETYRQWPVHTVVYLYCFDNTDELSRRHDGSLITVNSGW